MKTKLLALVLSAMIVSCLCVIAFCLCGCEHPHWPATNLMLIYAPNTTFEVEYYTNDGTGNNFSRTISVSLTTENPTYTLSSSCGHYYPDDLKNHPEWGTFSIKRTAGNTPVYGTPYEYVIVNGNVESTYSDENGWLEQKLKILIEQKYMFKVNDDMQHSFPISTIWHESMSSPISTNYPSISIN